MMRLAVLVLALVVAGAVAPGASAQDYPDRAVTFVVPFPPGGATDIVARTIAEEYREQLKQPFVIENRPGAGTVIGAAIVAKSKPDGYTLMMATTSTLAVSPNMYKSIPYDPVKDFAPIGLAGRLQFVLVAHPSVQANSLAELIALVREKPGEMSYASAGTGSAHHLFMEMFLSMAGLKAQHVPYRGSLSGLSDVVGGQVALMMCDLTPALPMIRDGKLKVFGLAGPQRVTMAPDIPTIAESGLPGYAGTGWFSVVTRAGTPKPVVDKLNGLLVNLFARTSVQEKFLKIGIEPLTSTPEELERHIAAELAKWGKVVKEAGISAE
jgi:tripartite-type tricarboxylate transporter receptor subunit TctC